MCILWKVSLFSARGSFLSIHLEPDSSGALQQSYTPPEIVYRTKGKQVSLVSMYVVAKLRLTLSSRSGFWLQAWKDREDEVTEGGVLSDEEA